MTKVPREKIATHMVMVLWKFAPKEAKNYDHVQDSLTKDLLHVGSWSSEEIISI